VYDSYGKKCNSRFLLNYGFVIEDNDANEFPVSLSLDKSSPLYDKKKAFFHKDFEMNKKFRISENIVDYAVVDLFSYLRFIYFDGDIDVLYKIISDNQKIIFEDITPTFYLISPITEDLEIKILTKIKHLMIEYISQYTTSLEDDNAILEKDKKEPYLTINQRNCIVMRQSEKKILKFYEYFASYCLGLFQMTEKVSILKYIYGILKIVVIIYKIF
jgi:histone-lysine N-methyltransferase SETD3